jgi:hypothetical protein
MPTPAQKSLGLPTSVPTIIFQYTQNPAESNPISKKEYLARWLSGIPCKSPCWEGVTPGKTTALEAAEIWSRNPIIKGLVVYWWKRSGDTHGRIEFTINSTEGEVNGFAYFSWKTDHETIWQIHFDNYFGADLKDIINVIGFPSHTIAAILPNYTEMTEDEWLLHILWLPNGFSIMGTGLEPFPMINDELSLYSMDYFPPGLEGFRNTGLGTDWFNKFYPLEPWHGYDGFEAYMPATRTPVIREATRTKQ